jgi:hypothetical protein
MGSAAFFLRGCCPLRLDQVAHLIEPLHEVDYCVILFVLGIDLLFLLLASDLVNVVLSLSEVHFPAMQSLVLA